MSNRLLVMAGGTGGHVFPGLAVAQFLKEKGWQVEWLGTADRMEAQLVPKHGFAINFINISGVRGNGLVRLCKAPFKILHATWQAIRILRQVKPDVVLGMGGYASGPGGIAAWLSGIPLVLHEQNAAPGLTNKLLARIAKKVLTAFDNANWLQGNAKKQQVGNPVRAAFAEISEKRELQDELRVLVSGGSLGAKVLNQCVPEAVKQLTQRNVQIWHQAGKGNSEAVLAAYKAGQVTGDNLKVTDFIDEMVAAYEWADVVICRAGALTVSEIALAGRCGIFVPLPHAVDDHQTKNAQYLVTQGAGILLPQSQLESGQLIAILDNLNSERERIIQISDKARQCGERSATEKVANVCIEQVGASR
ncbi:undecaprenyldiphospho-muramoylpentapeptide beta-N-acetylglucosaminyltransferase [Planctobacterium marinum]|uniref:undecaprenyldiphospho-muramoylpentapeptide beta-N-acetylglucosaminyltransferase n=1 Tax=Planctobacterium marinum TaxID=1631968 RepID=UPI001E57A69A|nr:undecaprenyldiphospho-muramoylpentapeptide beta-N-acetylglucosaminyltransferase [Planctobacterium marinum]MCC2605388.1 undecaprenyldiphospho-muramoylpentapeptide beta-N-acetylglucosaminyltransferase [Planctobacterium marinum]